MILILISGASPRAQTQSSAKTDPNLRTSVSLGAKSGASPGADLSRPDPVLQGRVLQSYGKLPLSFEANQGQADSRVKFLSRGSGYTLFLTGGEAVLALRASRQLSVVGRPSSRPGVKREPRRATDHGRRTTESSLAMKLVGANPNAPVAGTEPLPSKSNYFIGNDPEKWRTNVPNYAKVKYENVYPGVDLVYYGNQGQLEYDFVLAPGADPGLIRLDVAPDVAPGFSPVPGNADLKVGATRASRTAHLRLTANGDLVVKNDGGEVRFHKPVIYQPAVADRGQGTSERTPVVGAYKLAGSKVMFEVTKYDHSRPLIIDPVLSYSTYLGGTNSDYAFGIAVDGSGNAYLTGYTYSSNFPTTPGAFQTKCGTRCQDGDAFVAKLNPTGSTLLYSTYLGGSFQQNAYGIAVDPSGEAFIAGYTTSSDFPTTPGVFQPRCGGGCAGGAGDAFLTKLNPTGSALIYSTFLGGSNYDGGYGVAVDSSGNAYVTGFASSQDFPITPGAFQTAYGGGDDDAFVTKLNASGSALAYSTYLGGSGTDVAVSIALDSAGGAYVVGDTGSTNFPTSPAALQAQYGGGGDDGFATKFSNTGSMVYSTYLGGTGTDGFQGVVADASGEAYAVGFSFSTDYPTTPGAFQTALAGTNNAVVSKLDPNGSQLVYSTYLGGNQGEDGLSIALDTLGDAYLAGETTSTDFPTTPGAFQGTCYGCPSTSDSFLSELNPGGSGLLYSTFLGGSGGEEGTGIALDASGNVYLAGITTSIDFPVTPGAFQTHCGGGCSGNTDDAFMAKFVFVVAATPTSINFGSLVVGTSSAPQIATLTNGSTTTLNITGISVTGANSADFAETNTCGSTLAVGASCTFTVTFTPSATGTRTATINIVDDASNSPQTIALTGVGIQAAVTFSSTSLVFPTQLVYTTSKAQNVVLTNSGTSTLSITGIAATGQFGQTNTCSASLAPGATCNISVTFKPSFKGTLTGTVSVTDNAPGSPQTVSLTGTGTFVQLSPASLNFGSQPVGSTSLPLTITLTNKAGVALGISLIAIAGADPYDFAQTNTCGGSVARGASCFISVTFTPSAKGNRTAQVSVIDNGGGSPQQVSVTGLGTP